MRSGLIVLALIVGVGVARAEPELRLHVFPPDEGPTVGVTVAWAWQQKARVVLEAKRAPPPPPRKQKGLATIFGRDSALGTGDPTEADWAVLERYDRYPVDARGWFEEPGVYTIAVQLGPKGERVVSSVGVTGRERRLDVWVLVRESRLRLVTVERVHAGDPRVRLERQWTPTASGAPQYEIVNGTEIDIHGTRVNGNFFGITERWDGTAWRFFARGGICGTEAVGTALEPGGKRAAHEGAFAGGAPRPFSPGRYRFVLEYAQIPWEPFNDTSGGSRVERRRLPEHRQLEKYVLEDVFEIAP